MKMPNMNPCYICQNDSELNYLLNAITDQQIKLRIKWALAAAVYNDDETHVADKNSLSRWEVLGDDGSRTIIPSYRSYEDLWNRTFFVNPLTYDWKHFDIHSIDHNEYLLKAIEIIQQMTETWDFHETTKITTLAVQFDLFLILLSRLFSHSTRFGFLER
jgi:hypothetical protein